MVSYVRWSEIRAGHVERAGGEEAVAAGKQELLAKVRGRHLAEIRRSHGLTQYDVAEQMGVTKGRVSQIEQGRVSGQDISRSLRRSPRHDKPPGAVVIPSVT